MRGRRIEIGYRLTVISAVNRRYSPACFHPFLPRSFQHMSQKTKEPLLPLSMRNTISPAPPCIRILALRVNAPEFSARSSALNVAITSITLKESPAQPDKGRRCQRIRDLCSWIRNSLENPSSWLSLPLRFLSALKREAFTSMRRVRILK